MITIDPDVSVTPLRITQASASVEAAADVLASFRNQLSAIASVESAIDSSVTPIRFKLSDSTVDITADVTADNETPTI